MMQNTLRFGREIICDCTIIHLEITRLQLLFILYGTHSLSMDVVVVLQSTLLISITKNWEPVFLCELFLLAYNLVWFCILNFMK